MPSTLFNWAAAPALDLTSSCSSSFIFICSLYFFYLLFLFSLSAHYIYLYLFFIFYLNLLLQGISLHLPYHLLSSFMLSPPPDWDWNAVSKYRDGREASILDPTNWYYAFATSEICELIQGCKIHGSVSWRIMKQGMDMVCISICFFPFVFFWFACEDEVISITEMFTWWIIKQGKAPFKGWTHFWPEPLAFCTTPHPSFSVPSCLVMMILIYSVPNFWQDFLSLLSVSYWASQILSVSDILIWGNSS